MGSLPIMRKIIKSDEELAHDAGEPQNLIRIPDQNRFCLSIAFQEIDDHGSDHTTRGDPPPAAWAA